MERKDIDHYESLFETQPSTNVEQPIENKQAAAIIICEECKLPAVSHGNTWECTSCGTILEELIDTGAEWRLYPDGSKNDSVRCSVVINNLLPQSSHLHVFGCVAVVVAVHLAADLILIKVFIFLLV